MASGGPGRASTPSMMSTTGFAVMPGTAVLPMCSIGRPPRPGARPRRTRSASNRSGQRGSYASSTTRDCARRCCGASKALPERGDEPGGPAERAGARTGLRAALRDQVVGLEPVRPERVRAAPQEDPERPVERLAPALGDLVVRCIQPARPFGDRELVVPGLALDLDDL